MTSGSNAEALDTPLAQKEIKSSRKETLVKQCDIFRFLCKLEQLTKLLKLYEESTSCTDVGKTDISSG